MPGIPVEGVTGRRKLSLAVVSEVARREGVEPVELTPPLYEVVDPDALDALFAGETEGSVTFTYCGYDVTVDSDGTVTVGE